MTANNMLRVLVAEDDFLVSEEIVRVLRHAGYEVVGQASNGEKAFEMTCALHPDAVIMDIKMPKMDGLEAARMIHNFCPTPVIIMTAYESKELVEEASRSGISAYLTKPPTPSEIERALMIGLARHRDLVRMKELYGELETQKKELEKYIQELRILRGFLPICSYCKKIRDDEGYWQQVEQYIEEHSEAEFTHGLCPECAQLLYDDIL